jgi:ssDNA-binding Zn-finger/Zn-ribbon topoisomerase 1
MTQKTLCKCNKECQPTDVLKDGPNKGRKFFACPSKECNFFMWVTDPSGKVVCSFFQRGNCRYGNSCRFSHVLKKPSEVPKDYTGPVCEDCKGKLLKRTGEYGSFWGCENYPGCDFTKTQHQMDKSLPLNERIENGLFTSVKLNELKEYLKEKQIPCSGTKDELIKRLKQFNCNTDSPSTQTEAPQIAVRLTESLEHLEEAKIRLGDENELIKSLIQEEFVSEKISIDNLKILLKLRKLPISGNKNDLIQRLYNSKLKKLNGPSNMKKK